MNRNSAVAAAIKASAAASRAVVRTSSAAPAITSPAVIGMIPACTTARQGRSRQRCQKPAQTKVSAEEGAHSAPVAVSAPATPPTRRPISAETSMFGPGAACASA